MLEKNSKPHYGWVIVFVGFMIMSVDFCIVMNCPGLFIKSVTEEFGVNRGSFAVNNMIMSAVAIIISLFFGKLYTMFKVKTVLLFGLIIMPIGYGAYGFAKTIEQFYLCSVAVGIGLVCSGFVPVSTLLTRWFHEKRGLAVGIAFTGTGAGGLVFTPFIAWLIQSIGWRKTYMLLAVIMLALIVPLVLLFIKDHPEDKNTTAYGSAEELDEVPVEGMMLREAIKTPQLWMLFVAAVIISGCSCSMIQHLSPYISDLGYTAIMAANIGAISLGALAIGKVVHGQIYDKKGETFGTYLGILTMILTLVLYIYGNNPTVLFAGVLMSGIGNSVSSVTYPVMTQKFFGKKDYSAVYGIFNIATNTGIALGVFATAKIYDIFGSYKYSWIFWVILCLLSGVLYTIVNNMKIKKFMH